MNPIWVRVIPLFLAAMALAVLWAARRLRFFSKRARDLKEVHVEFRELRIEEFTALACSQADNDINREGSLSRRQRRRAALDRIETVRDGLRLIIQNSSLCVEVGRFHIRKIEDASNMPLLDREHLAVRIFDRGAMCQFMAAASLAKTYWLELCMIAWPLYLPRLADSFDMLGHNLPAWYGCMVQDVLQLAKEDERDGLFENARFALTGIPTY